MDYFPLIILGIVLILLIAGAFLWSGRSLLPDHDLKEIKSTIDKIITHAGYENNLTIKRGKSFYSKDRKTIYIRLSRPETFNENIIRRSIHEVAHCLNRDASEHGIMFQQIEEELIVAAKELKLIVSDIEVTDCLTYLKEENSEERAHFDRFNYAISFDPKMIY